MRVAIRIFLAQAEATFLSLFTNLPDPYQRSIGLLRVPTTLFQCMFPAEESCKVIWDVRILILEIKLGRGWFVVCVHACVCSDKIILKRTFLFYSHSSLFLKVQCPLLMKSGVLFLVSSQYKVGRFILLVCKKKKVSDNRPRWFSSRNIWDSHNGISF